MKKKKKPVRRWHDSGVCGGLDSCGSGYECVILNPTETSDNMKGEEVDQMSDYQLMNNKSALWSYSTISRLSWLFTWGKSPSKATPYQNRDAGRGNFSSPVLFVFVTALLLELVRQHGSRDGSVAIATCYGRMSPRLSGPIQTHPRLTLLPVQCEPGLFPIGKASGEWRSYVQLYLYRPSVPSWHVTGQPLPLRGQQFMLVAEINTAQDEALWLHFELKISYRNF
jgi:hypothetical protein